MYSAYQLDFKQREDLLKQFPTRYPRVVADHITVRFGGNHLPLPEMPEKAEIVGMADDGSGLQALIVRVNGNLVRQDGSIYHITWSLDPNKQTPPELDSTPNQTYKPVHSNTLVQAVINPDGTEKKNHHPDWCVQLLKTPTALNVKPVLRYTSAELKKKRLVKEI